MKLPTFRLARLPAALTAALVVAGATAAAGAGLVTSRSVREVPQRVHGIVSTPESVEIAPAQNEQLSSAPARTTAPSGPDFQITCDDLAPQGPTNAGGGVTARCTLSSLRGMDASVDLSCEGPAWLTCGFEHARVRVAPGQPVVAYGDARVARDAPPGTAHFRIAASDGTHRHSDTLAFEILPPGAVDLLTLDCDVFDRMLPGETKRTDCTVRSDGFRGELKPSCEATTDLIGCTITPKRLVFDRDGEVMIQTVWTSAVVETRGTFLFEVLIGLRPGEQLHWNVTFPEPKGTYAIACTPDSVEMESTDATPIDCTVTSHGGFDGYVELHGGASSSQGWSMSVPITKVRVTPTQPARATLELRTENVPPGSYPQVMGVEGDDRYAENNDFIEVNVS